MSARSATPSLSRLLLAMALLRILMSVAWAQPAIDSSTRIASPTPTASPAVTGATSRAAVSDARLLVVLIGGMDSDPTPAQLKGEARRGVGNSGLYQLQTDLKHPRILTEYFNWNGTRGGRIADKSPPQAASICACIRDHLQAHARDRVAVVGNSWGGHTALDVARGLCDCQAPLHLDMVLFLDPSSAGRAVKNPRTLPRNVSEGANYFTRNTFVWGKFPDARVKNVDLADPAEGYFARGVSPAYDSLFSFPAHVAAEWDDRIHSDIKRRLLDLLRD